MDDLVSFFPNKTLISEKIIIFRYNNCYKKISEKFLKKFYHSRFILAVLV